MLTPRQLAAARWVAKGARISRIASELGIHRRTLARWKQDPAFLTEVRRIHHALCRPAPRATPRGIVEEFHLLSRPMQRILLREFPGLAPLVLRGSTFAQDSPVSPANAVTNQPCNADSK